MVRRLALALAVVAVMTGALAVAPTTIAGPAQLLGPELAEAQPGAPDFCGPWQRSWYVSSGRWWYFWWWRWCHSPSIPPPGFYIDWAGWSWFGPAPSSLSPGFQYSGEPPS
jgi:hypothetical protein